MEDHQVARFVAEAAGTRLLQVRAQLAGADPARLRVAPPPPPARTGVLRMLVSRTRPPPCAERLADILGAQVVPQGSAGAKAADVLLGAVDLYAHAGGRHEWDSAAQ